MPNPANKFECIIVLAGETEQIPELDDYSLVDMVGQRRGDNNPI